MAVYKRSYKGYAGPLTAPGARLWVLPRYSYQRLFQSRFLVIFLALCLFFPVGCAVTIYVVNNLSFLEQFGMKPGGALKIDGAFFRFYLAFQGTLCYLLTALVGPSLVAPDLANGALPLYFCRPFTRTGYVAGKLSVLGVLLSAITWVPGLILFVIQASVAGWSWAADHWWIATGLVTGSLVWILLLSLLALAMSAWVKWRLAAGALILGIFFAGAGFGAAVNGVMRTDFGYRFDLARLMNIIWADLFRLEGDWGASSWDAWTTLIGVGAVCIWLLDKKIRAHEVVKG
jgi:ABC-2 type transport system permease protein